jgi:serine/threonine-protein kinase RsbW
MDPLNIPAQLDSLGAIREYVTRAAGAAGIDKKAAYRLALAVDEIATNIITHGYDEAGLAGDIRITAEMDDDTLTVSLEDTAIPYDPLREPEPTNLHTPLEERKIGGLGIFLTTQGVDRFDYEWVDGKNRNIFVMNRPS